MNRFIAFKEKQHTSAASLKAALEVLLEENWHTIKNNDDLLANEPPKGILEDQKWLLQSMLDCQANERTLSASKHAIVEKNINLKHLKGRLNQTVSSHQLYYFDTECDYYFVGDLHSDAYVLKLILERANFYDQIIDHKPFKIIFLGDYVDRGKNHIKILESLMILKFLYPEHIYLLMGNHDIGHIENNEVTLYLRKAEEDMDYFYLYLNALNMKYDTVTDELVDLYLKFLNHLNVAAFIMTDKCHIKAVHGGIPRPDFDDAFAYLKQFSQLTDGTLDHHNISIKDSILWSDPSIQEPKPTIERKRFKFYQQQLENYLNHIGVDTVVRGHQAIETGCLELFDHQIYTIFSTGAINQGDENINPDTAYDFVTPKILKYEANKGLPMQIIPLN